MPSPNDRRYAQTHEWHKIDGTQVTIGITQFAVDELADLTYIEMTETEGRVSAGQSIGEIESVKATSDIYTSVDGHIVQVNQEVLDDPSIVNQDPYEQGWIVKIEVGDASQIESLMSAEEYDQSTG